MKSILYTIIAIISFCLIVNESEYIHCNLIGVGLIMITLLISKIPDYKSVNNLLVEHSSDDQNNDFFEMSIYEQPENHLNKFWIWFIGMISGIIMAVIVGGIILYGSGIL